MSKSTVYYFGLANQLRALTENMEDDGPTAIPPPREQVLFLLVSAADAIEELRAELRAHDDDGEPAQLPHGGPAAPAPRRRAPAARATATASRANVWRFAAKCSAGRHKADDAGRCTKCGAFAAGAQRQTEVAAAAPVVHCMTAVMPTALCGTPRANLLAAGGKWTAEPDKVTCPVCIAEGS